MVQGRERKMEKPSDPEGSHEHCWEWEGHEDQSLPSCPLSEAEKNTVFSQGATAWWSPDT